MSFAPDFVEDYRRLALYVDRILSGESPGNLPIEQPRDVKLVINLRTARALGIDIPLDVMVSATEIIDG